MYNCSVLKACEELRMSIQCLHRSHWAPPRGSSWAGRFRFAWLCVFLSLYIWSFRAFFLWIFAPWLSIGFLCICCSCFFPCFLSLPTTLPITLGFAFRTLDPQTNATTRKIQANVCPIHAKQKSKILESIRTILKVFLNSCLGREFPFTVKWCWNPQFYWIEPPSRVWLWPRVGYGNHNDKMQECVRQTRTFSGFSDYISSIKMDRWEELPVLGMSM